MLKQKSNITGIDVLITNLQTKLHTYLCTEWGLDENAQSDWLCYDRCYRAQTKDGFIPSFWNGTEYKEVLLNDNTKVVSFFGVGNTFDHNNEMITANVHLVFFVNLVKLEIDDEKARQDVMKFSTLGQYGFNFQSLQIGIDSVLSEYSNIKIKYKDLQPYHIFRLNYTINYNVKKHIC